MKRKMMVKTVREPVRFRAGKWEYETRTSVVRVMAESEGYAMVRCKGAMPHVCPIKELSDLTVEELG